MSSPVCFACNVERKLVAVAAFTKDYDIHSFECPICHSTLRLAVRREPTWDRVPGHA